MGVMLRMFLKVPGGVALVLLLGFLAAAPRNASATAPNFNLVDLHGRNHSLRRAEGKVVVLFFTGNGCPIARQSVSKLKALRDRFGDDLTLWIVNTYTGDALEDCIKEYRDFSMWPLTYLRDPRQVVAMAFDVERTAEVVAISVGDWSVVYQGAIDDQFSEGAQRPKALTNFLQNVLTECLADKPVKLKRTQAHGCRINYAVPSDRTPISYAGQVAPLLEQHCVECHRAGGIGPWEMNGYAEVKDYARMIEEVLLTRRMPPWHADPTYGHWANERTLTTAESQVLVQWVKEGAPRAEGADPLARPLPALADWPLGKPDFVLKLPQPESIPATGVLDYRHVTVDLPGTNGFWFSGLDVKPGNRRVVHHVIVRAKWDDGPDDGSGNGVMLVGWAPGLVNGMFPSGTGKHVPPGAKLDIELHYTTIGSPQTDQTEIACYLLPEKPARELFTREAIQLDLDIAPGTDDSREVAVYAFKRPATIYSLMPHMHLRGKWMEFDLLLPTGKREVLLNVPRYDFNWQTVYRFAEPLHVPAGSWLAVRGGFDNSAGNPANPDPKKRVHFGQQSWDEMFIGFFEAADDPENGQKMAERKQ
jgi:mono/diheme cytochrome c family protein/peroxiredoxin